MRRAAAAGGVAASLALLAGCSAGGDGPPPDRETIRLGQRVYARSCAACHGAQGEGAANWQAPNDAGELPPPPHGPAGHTWMHSDAMLSRIISEGWRDPFNKTERLTMPAFEDVLTPEEIRAVIAYLKTLWTDEQRQFQWEESRDDPFPPKRAGA